MGRHSDPDPRWFWLSLGAAAAKLLVLIGLLVAASFALLSFVGDDDGGVTPKSSPTTSATPPVSLEEQTAAPPADDPTAPTVPVGATVQVLDASGLSDALEEAVAALERLGLDVVTTGPAVRRYDRTTVFWSGGLEEQAEALRAVDGRFGVIEPNDRLDQSIDLHVVVGADWTDEAPQSPSPGT